MYALFMQVLLMARVLIIAFSDCPAERQDIKEETDIYKISTSLEDLCKRGQEKGVHPLILNRLQRILQEVQQCS